MSETKDGGSAFPHEARNVDGPESGFGPSIIHIPASSGMTLRDYFAGQALAGIMAGKIAGSAQSGWQEVVTWDCYSVADAMLTERANATGA